MSATVTGAVGLDHVPEPIRSLHRLDRVDYVDLFALDTTAATDRSAEQWARAILEEGQAARRFAFIPWRLLLGLRLGPSHAPGWPLARTRRAWTDCRCCGVTCRRAGADSSAPRSPSRPTPSTDSSRSAIGSA